MKLYINTIITRTRVHTVGDNRGIVLGDIVDSRVEGTM